MDPEFELGTDGPTLVLVGVDGSVTSTRAAAYAAGLVRRQGSALLAVHVRATPGLATLNAAAATAYAQTQDELSEQLGRELREAAASIGLEVEFVAVSGDPFDQLVRIAQERRVDAVVVGASEQAGHRLVGSLATRLVRASRWPVTVVP